MRLLGSIMLAILVYLAVAVPVFAGDRRPRLAAEYLELAKVKETFDITIETYVDQIVAQSPGADPAELRKVFETYMGWEVLKKPTTKIVADTFTEEELVGINKFYRSKVGKALANKSPALSAAISQLIGKNLNLAIEDLPK